MTPHSARSTFAIALSTASGAPAWLGALTCLQVFRGASLQERADDLGLEDPGEAFGVLLERVLGQFAAGGRSLDACGPAVTLLTDAGGETVARAAFGFASNSVDGFVASPGPDKLFMLAPSQGPSLAWLMSVTNVLVTVAGRDLFA